MSKVSRTLAKKILDLKFSKVVFFSYLQLCDVTSLILVKDLPSLSHPPLHNNFQTLCFIFEPPTPSQSFPPQTFISHLIFGAFAHLLLHTLVKRKELQGLLHGLSWMILFFFFFCQTAQFMFELATIHLLDKVLLNAMVDQVGKAGVLESWAQLLRHLSAVIRKCTQNHPYFHV